MDRGWGTGAAWGQVNWGQGEEAPQPRGDPRTPSAPLFSQATFSPSSHHCPRVGGPEFTERNRGFSMCWGLPDQRQLRFRLTAAGLPLMFTPLGFEGRRKG